jgi:hypothetical protein
LVSVLILPLQLDLPGDVLPWHFQIQISHTLLISSTCTPCPVQLNLMNSTLLTTILFQQTLWSKFYFIFLSHSLTVPLLFHGPSAL